LEAFPKAEEMTDDHKIASLFNAVFYEHVYIDGYYYNPRDFVKMFAKRENFRKFYDNIEPLFHWQESFDFTSATINHSSYRIMSLFEYPKMNKEKFFDFIINHDGNFNLSFFYKQTTKDAVLNELKRRKQAIHDKLDSARALGSLSKKIESDLEEIDNDISFIDDDNENMFLMSVYLMINEIDHDRIQQLSDRFSILLNENRIVYKIHPLRNLKLDRDFESIAPINSNLMKNYKFITTTGVKNNFPFLTNFEDVRNVKKIKRSQE